MKQLIVMMTLLGLLGCGEAMTPDAPTTTVDVDYETDRADAIAWRAATTGVSISIDTVLTPVDGEERWLLRGESTARLSAFRAYDERGRAFGGELIDPQRFEVALSEDQATAVVAGARVYFDLFTEDADIPLYHGMARFAPRLTEWSGATSLYVTRAVNPVIVGGWLKFRGRAKARAGFALHGVEQRGIEPALTEPQPNSYLVDFSPRELLVAARSEAPLRFVGSDVASTPIVKHGKLQLRITQLGVGTKSPFDAWPRQACDEEIAACLNALTSGDTEACGYANEVRACNAPLPTGATKESFLEDLRDIIAMWYADNDANVRARDGHTLPSALNRLELRRVKQLSAERVDQLGHNPEHFDGFSHVDTVYRDSAKIWIAVYDHAGRRVAIHTVNDE